MLISTLDRDCYKESALILAEQTFGYLDLGSSTVREELKDICWSMSVGIFDDKLKCYAQLLLSQLTIGQYTAQREIQDISFDSKFFDQLNCMQGDSLICQPECKYLLPTMFKHLLKKSKTIDCIWGSAHPALENQDFWKKHATLLGTATVNSTDLFFMVPISEKARNVLKDFQQIKENTNSNLDCEQINLDPECQISLSI